MSQNKQAYFQNGQSEKNPNTPTPGKKKYKSERAIVVQPRFEEPLYRNYDVYETDGVNGKAKHGPGAGWHDMGKYNSIKEFIEARRKKMKDKYKADDSWIEDDGSHTKKKKMARRIDFLLALALDFKADEYTDAPVGNTSDNPAGQANEIGGYLDQYLPQNDFEGESPDKLNFGRDYTEDETVENKKELSDEELKKLTKKYLQSQEPPLMGLPNGIEPKEDLDADKTIINKNPQYGTTDSGNTTYEGVSR